MEGRSSSRLQDENQLGDTHPRDRGISRYISQMLLSLRILRICVDYANTLTIMTTAQPTSTRCPLQRRQKSNHVLTITGTGEHPDLNTLDSTCQRLAQPNAVAVTRDDPGPQPTWWHKSSCTHDGFSTTYVRAETALVRMCCFHVQRACDSLGHVRNHDGL